MEKIIVEKCPDFEEIPLIGDICSQIFPYPFFADLFLFCKLVTAAQE